ncbi:Alginate biosynthesis protein AlgA [Caprobacter fermentans]|uniref:Alginate biosynthesis protein AlgA n=1 Tax=Caproicibacter fermentans TaxID=2576756 RepID=A0A6N8HWJ9_9FIRM|nr:Alginate biosynthesis protein AlgA [Caproicibacter fermentans]
MYTVLLSGGSGKRLWPLSGPMRSKQYLKILTDEETGLPCSMAQRVWKQIRRAELDGCCVICTDETQAELLSGQLGKVRIALEPEGRDTFAAVALSCAYLKSRLHAKNDDIVCVMPVDPYTEQSFFDTVRRLPAALSESGAEIALMGVKPTGPSVKYGYILPKGKAGDFLPIDSFQEKPDEKEAKRLLGQGALWNCGVFCLRVGSVLEKLSELRLPKEYDALCARYGKLPAVSFDYAVLEKSSSLVVVPFDGMWKDLGTWGAVSEIMDRTSWGNCMMDPECIGSNILNETNIPVVAMGIRDLMVVASSDGILVTDKNRSQHLKEFVTRLEPRPVFEERSWGTASVLDFSRDSRDYTMIRKVRVRAGGAFGPVCRQNQDKLWTVLSGSGRAAIGDRERALKTGDCVQVPRGTTHSVSAAEELVILEVQRGSGMPNEDRRGKGETPK